MLFALITCSAGFTQELPPIQNFTPVDYEGENQNWDISQSTSSKLIYIANNKGLLEYNGARWRLYPSPNESIMRSVEIIDDRIYTGCYMEFGYWQKDSLNQLKYNSLSKKLKFPLIEDEEFWNIEVIGDLRVFQSKKAIYILNKEEIVNRIDTKSTITKVFKVGQTIYFQRLGKGLFTIKYGQDQLVSDASVVKDDEIVSMFQNESETLVVTQNNGFYSLNADGRMDQLPFLKDDNYTNFSFYKAVRLKDGKFVLGTISNGLVYLNKDGVFEKMIDQNNGLSNNTVLSIYEDDKRNVWLGLDNGVAVINTEAPFRVFNDDRGVLGSIYAAALKDDILYLGTNQGLFYKNTRTGARFQFIRGTQGQVWSLKTIEGTLFCGHHTGTFIVKGESVAKIANIPGTWGVSTIYGNPDLLLQGNYNGLYILERSESTWRLRNKIKGFNNSSRYFESSEDEIFVNHEYNGIFRLKVDSTFFEVQEVEKDTLIRGANSGLVRHKNDILYAYKKGILKYDETENRFVNDSVLDRLYAEDDYESGKMIFHGDADKLWVFTSSGIKFLTYDILSNEPKLQTINLTKEVRNGILGYENIINTDGDTYLVGTTSGYITFDSKSNSVDDFEVFIADIALMDKVNRNSYLDESFNTLGSDQNSLEFSFYTPEFNKLLKTQYRFKLEGLYDYWSGWSKDYSVTFENLPHGAYTFKVQSKIGEKVSTNTASYGFTIAKPWYISNLMLLVYAIALIFFSIFMHNVYRSYYRRQRAKLIAQNQQELAFAKVQSEKEIINIKNQQLQLEYKSKSKELAASTMSIIKKNELLSIIKDELLQIDQKAPIQPVIQIIDKNLKQNDDWELFKEAFNNADSTFLKKIKELHPTLSPNDLKLCAYLRLNLSSKEIAQLLHISPRSVEIKRYRLRKKMNLEHEKNLVNYILGV
ncbi:triple tyrosine motif-containing protein [uncultured Croceitalea sp.]|uniref:helix-turn-helix and ligand-binding sensor domain-containing protein n=1 Tax=uncultured Croceitalea sp. TaxID=1798908 RepID=UPI0033066A02